MGETASGRVPAEPGSCRSGDAATASSSLRDGDPSRESAYFPEDLRGADRLGWIAGFYGPELPPGVAQELIDLAYEWSEARR